ncbi:MAG TPA: ankyrin repeat domain-containing protein [Phycisphaerae bacterium]|nr:ankyrin repeat domain-containing protein [Phycisphaerae bacterium]
MINNGADVNAKDNDGETALTIAQNESNSQAVIALLNAGAKN